jgi:ribosomal protection tetracycline resistance protein
MGRVDAGTTTTDALALEKQRGITIRASTVSVNWKGTKINLIDTPGHMDFIAEVGRSLAVLDGVVLVISAKEGVQPQTRVIFSKLIEMQIPTLIFINKIDRTGVSLDDVYADIRKKLAQGIIPMQRARHAGQRGASVEAFDNAAGPLHEAIISESDTLLSDYMAGKPVSGEACMRALRDGTRRCKLFPVYLGAALHDLGIEPLLDAIPLYFQGGGDRDDPLSAMAYKVERDESGRKRLYMRVFSGEIMHRGWVELPGGESMQIKNLLAAHDGRLVPADRITAGDIGVLMDAPSLNCGDFIGRRFPLRSSEIPAPLLFAAVSPASPAQRPALMDALQQLTEEDPSLAMRLDARTGEIMLRLYGSLQREIIRAMLLERFGLDAVFSPMAAP